jgi:light-regulated signal transduction histidine kinase (bacteriophytochrome)
VRHNISIRTELGADLPQTIGDRVQLQQVAMNLLANSIEAMKDVDGIREMVIQSQRAENEQILISVSDIGMGLPPQLAERIFDPFFTTKPTAPAWDFASAGQSLSLMMGAFGQQQTMAQEPHSHSRFRATTPLNRAQNVLEQRWSNFKNTNTKVE